MEYIYASLLLHKLGKPIDEEHLKKVISSTGAHVDEGKVKLLVTSLKGVDIENELKNAVAVAAPVSAPAAEKKEEKVKEEKASAAEGLSSLFG